MSSKRLFPGPARSRSPWCHSKISAEIPSRNISQVEARLAGSAHVSPTAYEAYLEGREALSLRTRESLQRGIVAFDRAIAIDPNSPLPYAGLARIYAPAPVVGERPADTMPKARDAAMRALA